MNARQQKMNARQDKVRQQKMEGREDKVRKDEVRQEAAHFSQCKVTVMYHVIKHKLLKMRSRRDKDLPYGRRCYLD